MLGEYGELQVHLAEWILKEPYYDRIPAHAAPLFWDLGHILGVVSNRLGDWVKLGDFTEWAVPVDLFPQSGPLGNRHAASFFIASNLVRPLTWLGVLEESDENSTTTPIQERLIRKAESFERLFKIAAPVYGGTGVH
ncbi:MAG: hypothetical protein WA950_02690 [Shinella sp.]|uniref:hypothetical protein n=1 Tax=Shinella sp. TaxID=1870904 RepID=UPI003C74ADAE